MFEIRKLGLNLDDHFFQFCFVKDMKGDSDVQTKEKNEVYSAIIQQNTTRQHQYIQTQIVVEPKQTTTTQKHSSQNHHFFAFSFVSMLLLLSLFSPAFSLSISSDSHHQFPANQTLKPVQELQNLKRVRAYLKKINKPSVKTIQALILISLLSPSFHLLFLFILRCSLFVVNLGEVIISIAYVRSM